MGMNITDLKNEVANRLGASKAEGARATDAVIQAIVDAVVDSGELVVPGFIKMEKIRKEACERRNPATGAIVQVPAKWAVKVKIGANFKKKVEAS